MPIRYWNKVALDANRVSHTAMSDPGTLGPPLSARALAIVHLAMYDAYAAIDPTAGAPYLPGLPSPPPGPPPPDVAAAVAGAAYTALTALFPSQQALFDQSLGAAGLSGPAVPASLAYGHFIAQRLLAERAGDPGSSPLGYMAPVGPGAHRVDPDNPGQLHGGFHAPFYGALSRGFAIQNRPALKLNPNPGLGTPAYQNAIDQVRRLGIAPELMGTLPSPLVGRSPAETLAGLYWAYDGAVGLGTPPRLYNQIVREVAQAQGNTPAQDARLFALLNVAMADAGILAWEEKYIHTFWRPVVGIREHDLTQGGDPAWLPLGAPATNTFDATRRAGAKNFTPPFPAYPSGHATFGAAAFHITRRFYSIAATDTSPDTLFQDSGGTDIVFVSEELNGINADNRGTIRPLRPRTFPGGLWEMIIENSLSRIFLGVHWVFDAFALDSGGNPDLTQNIGGVPLGIGIANDIFNTGMQPSP
jgi:membrane-associated phospholipid phosphatase